MNAVLFLAFGLTFLVIGATWSSHDGQRLVVQVQPQSDGNTKVVISSQQNHEADDESTTIFHSLEHQAKQVIEKVGDSKDKLLEKSEFVAKNAVPFRFSESTKGALKDTMVKMQNWDPVDSPKRIGEDIERNASKQVERGIEEVKETVENVKETSLCDVLRKVMQSDVLFDKIQGVISWIHLLGFCFAYGMGMWVTFLSTCVLGNCDVPNQQFEMLVNKMNMVYFRAMGYCVGAAVFGYYLVQTDDQGRKGVILLSNKMEMFQGFNLLYALFIILTNIIFLEPRVTKLMVERKKMGKEKGKGDHKVTEKLKKLNAYSSTLNVSMMVVLTWHLAYIGRLIQAAGY